MITSKQVLSLNTINGCLVCESHTDLVYCESLEPDPSYLCGNCREEFLFDDEGRLKEKELEEAVMLLAAELEEDEEKFYSNL
jgi:transposase-like protein